MQQKFGLWRGLWFGLGLLSVIFMGISCANIAASPTLQADTSPATGQVIDAATLTIYADALAEGWEDWSWDSTIDFAATNVVHDGNAAIAVTHNEPFVGFSPRAPAPIATAGYNALAFWIYGHGAPLSVSIQTTDEATPSTSHDFTPANGAWTEVVIPLTAFGSPAQIARITWQSVSNAAQSTYYLDEIRLVGTAPPPADQLTLHVDVAAGRKSISPYIYGMNEYGTEDPDATLLAELRLPVRR